MPSKILLRSLFVFGFCAGSNAIAAEIILQPVSASGNHTIQGTEIRLESGGQLVRLEVQIRGFAPHLLKLYQARLNSAGYSNGSSVDLRAAAVDCPSEDRAGDLFCRNTYGGESGMGAPECVDVIYGPAVELRCEAGWINQSRTDWVMFGLETYPAVDISTSNYRWGSVCYPDAADDGSTYYAGTLMVDVPVGAVGSYTIGWYGDESWLMTAQGDYITPMFWTAAKITVLCTSNDQCAAVQCREAVCNTITGECEWEPQSDGTACDDGNACTLGDRCVAGGCQPVSTATCNNGNGCNVSGSCNPQTGQCSPPVPKPDGTSCSDGNACTLGDRCVSGQCAPLSSVRCAGDVCADPGPCIPETGECSALVPKPDGTACSDYNPCTLQDQCVQGECISGPPRICANPCRTCHPTSGNCRPVPNGTECDDGKACTLGDRCESGNCIPASRVVCTNGDACNDAGACSPQTGECSPPVPKPDGSTCDDGDLCTANQCQQGECLAADIPDCIQWYDMLDCLLGPENPKPIECDAFDLNSDGFVDMFDVALLLESY